MEMKNRKVIFETGGSCIPGKRTNIFDNTKTVRNTQLHSDIWCNECCSEIRGYRYRCLDCPNFDLCSSCEVKQKHSHHTMLRTAKPSKAKECRNINRIHRLWMTLNCSAASSNKNNQIRPLQGCKSSKVPESNVKRSSIQTKVQLSTSGSLCSSPDESKMKKLNDYEMLIQRSLSEIVSPCSSPHNLAFIASKNRFQSDQSKPLKIISKIINTKRERIRNINIQSNSNKIESTEKRQGLPPITQFKPFGKCVNYSSVPVSSSMQSSEKDQTLPQKSKLLKANTVPSVDVSVAVLPSADSNDRAKHYDLTDFRGIIKNLMKKYERKRSIENNEGNSSSIPKVKKNVSIGDSVIQNSSSVPVSSFVPVSSSIPVSLTDAILSLVPVSLPDAVSSSVQSLEKNQKLPLQSTSITVPLADHEIRKTISETNKFDRELKSTKSETPTELRSHPNPRINESVHYMTTLMGFSNDNDWLTCLLETVDGNIVEAVKILNPYSVL